MQSLFFSSLFSLILSRTGVTLTNNFQLQIEGGFFAANWMQQSCQCCFAASYWRDMQTAAFCLRDQLYMLRLKKPVL